MKVRWTYKNGITTRAKIDKFGLVFFRYYRKSCSGVFRVVGNKLEECIGFFVASGSNIHTPYLTKSQCIDFAKKQKNRIKGWSGVNGVEGINGGDGVDGINGGDGVDGGE